jgi:DNA-binding MarR family transcriptional regulator
MQKRSTANSDPALTDGSATMLAGERLTHALLGLELALIRHRSGVRQRLGVSEDELAVLLCLSHGGSASQAGLATLSTLSRSGMGALLQRLEHEGLVERRAVPGDRRMRLVRLSERGHARLAAAYRERDEALDRLLARSSDGVAERMLGDLARAVNMTADEESAPAEGDASPIWRCWG